MEVKGVGWKMKIIIDEPRSEEIKIVLKLPTNTPLKYRHIAKKIDSDITMSESDTLDITYCFRIDYFGKTAERFQNILLLAEKGYLVSADLNVLDHKICLIQEIIRKIDGMNKDGSN
jgi:hypothetical protein